MKKNKVLGGHIVHVKREHVMCLGRNKMSLRMVEVHNLPPCWVESIVTFSKTGPLS